MRAKSQFARGAQTQDGPWNDGPGAVQIRQLRSRIGGGRRRWRSGWRRRRRLDRCGTLRLVQLRWRSEPECAQKRGADDRENGHRVNENPKVRCPRRRLARFGRSEHLCAVAITGIHWRFLLWGLQKNAGRPRLFPATSARCLGSEGISRLRESVARSASRLTRAATRLSPPSSRRTAGSCAPSSSDDG